MAGVGVVVPREGRPRCGWSTVPKDPADRIAYRPGDAAQCDLWFPPATVPLGAGQSGSPPVLVMVASFSRFITGRMLPTRATPDLLAGMWSLLAAAAGRGAAAAGVGQRGRHRPGRAAGGRGARVHRDAGGQVVPLRPYDPESKGIVERANGYLETSFLPGRVFASPADFNAQLAGWLPLANTRQVRSLGARPADLIEQDRAAMRPLPRLRRRPGSRRRCGCRATTTCGCWATTTPSTRR